MDLEEKEWSFLVKVRQDAWSHEDDLLLAETVLRHVREGSTQLKAFDEVGDNLNRTSAACGFRWNAEVRRKYDQAVDIAKRQRKEKKRAIASGQKVASSTVEVPMVNDTPITSTEPDTVQEKPVSTNLDGELNLVTVIEYLQSLNKNYQETSQSKHNLEKAQKENEMLHEIKNDLEQKLEQSLEQLNTIQEDYQVLIQIMDRARKMVVFDDQEQDSLSAKAFRMEKNGNLEQVAR